MAVPKRRLSKCRRDRRRANWKLEAPGYVACPQCHEPKMPHRVCPTCGHYKGEKMIVEMRVERGGRGGVWLWVCFLFYMLSKYTLMFLYVSLSIASVTIL